MKALLNSLSQNISSAIVIFWESFKEPANSALIAEFLLMIYGKVEVSHA